MDKALLVGYGTKTTERIKDQRFVAQSKGVVDIVRLPDCYYLVKDTCSTTGEKQNRISDEDVLYCQSFIDVWEDLLS